MDPALCRQRNIIERFFNKLKHFRRVATRFDKLARNFLAAVALASTRIWIRNYESTTKSPLSRCERIGWATGHQILSVGSFHRMVNWSARSYSVVCL